MNESEAIEKLMTVGSGTNSYKAVSEASMLNLVKPLFKKYKLIIFPIEGDIKDNVSVWEKTDFKGNIKNDLRAITELKVFYKIVDTESGENETLVGFGNCADPQDKGAGKAFTYSFKNVLSKTFMLFSGEDTDNTHSDDINKDPKQSTQSEIKNHNLQSKPPVTSTIEETPSVKAQTLIDLGKKHGLTFGQIKATILKNYKKKSIDDLTVAEYAVMQAKIVAVKGK